MTSQPFKRSRALEAAIKDAREDVEKLTSDIEEIASMLAEYHDKYFIFIPGFRDAQMALDAAWRASKLAAEYLT